MIITGIILDCHWPTSILFDPKSTYSYMFIYLSIGFDLLCDRISVPIYVSTSIRDPLVVNQMY